MLSPLEAERKIFGCLLELPREDCPVASAHGRILREALKADRDQPPFDRIAIDGFALRFSSIKAGVRRFRIGAVQAPGMRPFPMGDDRDVCIEVMAGSVLPKEADCVVPVEWTRREGEFMALSKDAAPRKGGAFHPKGSEHRAGDTLIEPGLRLGGREIAVAAAVGYPAVQVSQIPKIAVVSTGDELVDVATLPAPHQVRRSIDFGLRAALVGAGYPRTDRYHVRDIRHEMEHVLWHLIAEYDALVLTGGVSKGGFELMPVELERQRVRKLFQGVAQQPGNAFWFGLTARKTPVFALPGSPLSAFICLHRYVIPALDHSGGGRPRAPVRAVLATSAQADPKRTLFIPAAVTFGDSAQRIVEVRPTIASGEFGSLLGTDGFVELAPGAGPVPAGQPVAFTAWA